MSKTTTLKRPKIGFQDQLSLNAGQKYCSLMQVKSIAECSNGSILQYFIKVPFVIKLFVLSIFECPLRTGLTVQENKESLD